MRRITVASWVKGSLKSRSKKNKPSYSTSLFRKISVTKFAKYNLSLSLGGVYGLTYYIGATSITYCIWKYLPKE